jgi:transposase-like protein
MKRNPYPAATGERIRHMKEDTRKPEDRQSEERISSGVEKSVAEGFLFSAGSVSWPGEEGLSLDELARWGAQRLIACALRAEVAEYIERHAASRDESGRALVVRNGKSKARTIQIGSLPIEIEAPRVDDRRPDERFRSAILPPYLKRSRRLEEAIPIFYLRGWSTGDFAPALSELLGEEAKGFSPTQIVRMKEGWESEYREWKRRDLSEERIVYVYADGVNFSVRLEEDRLTCLAIIGVREDGTKVVLALEDGYRESTESWLTLLRDLRDRGLAAPKLAVGDGALGFWGALDEVYPTCRKQRCWVHKKRNLLDKLPDRLQEEGKKRIDAIIASKSRAEALKAVDLFEEGFSKTHPKAVECLKADLEEMLTYFDFPKEHWIHLRTTNPIESTFAPTKARTKKTKGAGSREAGLAMAFKLLTTAQKRWRRLNAPQLIQFVAAGAAFKDGRFADPLIAEAVEKAYRIAFSPSQERAAA